MNVRSRAARVAAALVVAGALFGVATAVEAAIPDGSGVIHGCYAKATPGLPTQTYGVLRVIDTGLGQSCQSNENALSWSQSGPKGATGPQGAPGTKGATGAAGPPGPAGTGPAFSHYSNLDFTVAPGKSSVIGSVHLPVGVFTLSATAQVHGDDSDYIDCYFQSSASLQSHGRSVQVYGSQPDIPITVLGDVTVTSPNTDVDFTCSADADNGEDWIVWSGASIYATQVASVTTSN